MFSNFLHFSNFYIKLSNFAVVLFSYFVFSINDNTDTYLPRNLPLSWNGFRKILVSSISFLANTTWKVDDINRTIFLRSIAYISFCGQPWTSLFCIHKNDGRDCRALHNREAVFTWKRGWKKIWQAPIGDGISQGITANHKRRNIRMSINEYISLILIGLHGNPPANSSEQAGVDQIRWTFVAGKL